MEQYSRRNSICIAGVKENDTRQIRDIIIDIAQQHSIDISPSDIDRSHRVGEKKGGNQRALLVKFTSYRAKKAFMKKKKELSEGLYFNEDLTKKRGELLYEARKRRKANKLKGAWSFDGRVYIKDMMNDTHEIMSLIKIEAIIQEVDEKIAKDPEAKRSLAMETSLAMEASGDGASTV